MVVRVAFFVMAENAARNHISNLDHCVALGPCLANFLHKVFTDMVFQDTIIFFLMNTRRSFINDDYGAVERRIIVIEDPFY